MAETLEVNQMLANNYEPKRMFRWLLELDGIDAFTATTFARPNNQAEDITIDYINQKVYHAGKDEWQELELVLHDPIAPSQAAKVIQWVRLRHNHSTGQMGYKSMYTRNFSLKMLDGLGTVVEKWNITNAWVKSSNFGELDYNNNDTAKVTVSIRFDNAVLEF